MEYLKYFLMEMTTEYEEAVRRVEGYNNAELLDFHARRLVEMAANIIMGYLLLIDAQRNEDFAKSAEIFITRAQADNKQKWVFIRNFDPRQLGNYKLFIP